MKDITTNLHVFTVATKDNHHLQRLLSSARTHNIDVNVLGMGEKYLGHGTKRVMVSNALKSYPPDDLFLFIDAYDVIFLSGKDELLEKYHQYYNGQLVYGAEHNFGMYSFDDIYYYLKYPVKKSTNQARYLNTGTIMGKISDGLKIFEAIVLNSANKSDQMDTIRYFCNNNSIISVDQDQWLFGVNGGRAGLEDQDYEIKNNRLYAKKTDNWPSLFHVPGKFFIGLDKIAYELGYMNSLPSYTEKKLNGINQTNETIVSVIVMELIITSIV